MSEEITTPNGSFEFIHTMTLGEFMVTAAVFLLLALQLLRWMLDSVWRRRG